MLGPGPGSPETGALHGGLWMVARSYTVAFEGIEARLVEVQCALAHGAAGFSLVGMAERSVSEAKERVRAALEALSIALPNRRITINLSPADLPKEGSHYDLAIALALLAAIGLLPEDEVARTLALGELSLDGKLIAVAGALPAALTAAAENCTLLCPLIPGREAAWVGAAEVISAATLHEVLQHFSGQAVLPATEPLPPAALQGPGPDLREVRGQERAKRALEIAAAGRHHLLMTGSPGAGKSMLALRLPGLLPPLSAAEALESAMIHSLAGQLNGTIPRHAPFRAPHHSASMAAMAGGGRGAKPGEISLAHNGVLFLDELPEFARPVLEVLRQPIESGVVSVARANAHVDYPCRFQLIAAANPCRCGWLSDPARACSKAPHCGRDYLARLSGPLLDRIDLRLELPPVSISELDLPPLGESSARVAARVAQARQIQAGRLGREGLTNADLQGSALERYASPDREGKALIARLAEQLGLTARGYHRLLRVARTIADLEGCDTISRNHLAEAAGYRLNGSVIS